MVVVNCSSRGTAGRWGRVEADVWPVAPGWSANDAFEKSGAKDVRQPHQLFASGFTKSAPKAPSNAVAILLEVYLNCRVTS